jgi:hypothetical protein
MPGRYSQIFENQPISNYVPLPLDLMGKALASKQASYDGALDEANKIEDDVLKVNAIDEHQPFKKQLINTYRNKIEGIADEISKTGDTSKVRELKRIATQWRNDPIRNELETSYVNKGLYQKDKIAKGDKYGEWHDSHINFTGDVNGQLNPFRYTGMGERQDHQKRAEDMMNNIKASSSEDYKIFDIDPTTGNITKIKQGQESIGRDRVLQLAKNKLGDFLSTKEGDDYIKELKYKFPKASPEQLQNEATKYLFNAGSNQIFSKSTIDKDFNWGPDRMNKEVVKDNPFTPGYEPIQPGQELDEKLTSNAQGLGLTGFRYKDGNIEPINDSKNIKSIYNIDGKEYSLSDIKAGKAGDKYKVNKVASISFGAAPASTEEVFGPEGKVKQAGSPIEAKQYGKQLGDIAYRLGIDVNKDNLPETQKRVGEAIKKLTTSNANYTKFDESTINNLSKSFGVKLKEDGTILDPGNMSFTAIKNIDGSLIDDTKKAEILNGARLLGAAKSLNGKTSPGDIEVQSTDGKTYYVNTNLPEFNKAFEQSHNMYSSIGKYINTGEELKDKDVNTYKNLFAQKQAKTISELNPNSNVNVKELEKNTKVINKEYDKSNNTEYVTILSQDVSGGVTPKVLIINHNNETINVDDLDNVATDLDWKNSRKIMGNFNSK